MSTRILIVGDCDQARSLYEDASDQDAFTVAFAQDGLEAFRALDNGTPDLVILDVDMPGLSGWDVLGVMRETQDWEDIPVVVKGQADSANPQPASSLGPTRRLPASANAVRLMAAVNDMLEACAQAAA